MTRPRGKLAGLAVSLGLAASTLPTPNGARSPAPSSLGLGALGELAPPTPPGPPSARVAQQEAGPVA
jgi:hypothetical protein